MEYKDIQNMEQLQEAHHELSERLEKAKKKIVRSSRVMREEITPINLMGKAIQVVSDKKQVPYDRNLLDIVRRLRKRIERL